MNQELNEQVAWKLGWRVNTPPYKTSETEKGGKWIIDTCVPNYCGSIQAAWEIVEFCRDGRMKEHDLDWNLRDLASCDKDSWSIFDITPLSIVKAFLKLPH